jgi:hypothetical protein
MTRPGRPTTKKFFFSKTTAATKSSRLSFEKQIVSSTNGLILSDFLVVGSVIASIRLTPTGEPFG